MAKSSFFSSLGRWIARIVLGLLALLVVAVAAGTAFEFYSRAKAAKEYPAPGQRIDIGGRKMHIDCRGQGSPTVILESGLDISGSLAWEKVHDTLAKTTRVCAYDRAGVMWSDPKPGPQNADGVADDLFATLQGAKIDGPLVMVCHSLGGPYIMDFTRKHPDRVKGLVFVDCSHPDQIKKLSPFIGKGPTEVPFAYRAAIALAWTGLVRLQPEPFDKITPERTRVVGQAYFPQTFAGTVKEQESIPTTFEQGGKLRTLGDRPLVVLTGLKPMADENLKALKLTRAQANAFQGEWKKLNLDAASWSSRSRQQDVTDSGHYIQNERPDLVIGAVNEVVATVRADEAHAAAAVGAKSAKAKAKAGA